MSADIAVLIPTLRRPDSLTRTLQSVLALTETTALVREIVVADNAPEGSAQGAVEAFAGSATPVRYVHAPVPGVATARNAALAATDAPRIAFIDDDEEALPGWLLALSSAHGALGADVVFGPIRGVIPDEGHWAADYLAGLFSRHGPTESGLSERAWGCGNSIMTRATALPGAAPFETRADQSGGEDDLLFAALRARGGRFGWAADAWVLEHAPAHRATLDYALRRAFAYGQSPSQAAAQRGDAMGVARWMAVGAVQAAGAGSVAGVLWALRRRERALWLDRAARGLGKVLWTERFVPRFYGLAEVARTDALAAG